MALKVLYFALEDCDFKVEGEIGLEENDTVSRQSIYHTLPVSVFVNLLLKVVLSC